jgi:hypothetical protein
MSIAAASGLAWALMLWQWSSVRNQVACGGLTIAFWLFVTCLVVLVGFTTWARGVFLATRGTSKLLQRLPWWVKAPWTTGAAGLLVPGLGLLLAGHPGRAARALWMFGPLCLSAAVLSQSARVWGWNRAAGADGLPGPALEVVILTAVGMALLGALAWMVHLLDGIRLAAWPRKARGRVRGDWFSVALVAAMAAFIVVFDPASVAQSLDQTSVVMRYEGFQVIPLYASLGAARLDPSQPAYVMQAAEIHDELGRPHIAREMRQRLHERWEPHAEILRREAIAASGVELADYLIGQEEDSLAQTPAENSEEIFPFLRHTE